MKRLLLVGFLTLMMNSSVLLGQDVKEAQYSLITKVTATWCTFCGTWGWDTYNSLLEDNQSKAIVIANHYSGDLINKTAEEFAENLDAFAQPLYFLDNTHLQITSSNRSNKISDVKFMVDERFKLRPVVNAGISSSLNGRQLNATVKTRFFQDTEGEYYVGVYAVEDGVINFQQSRSANANHKNVLRGQLGENSFGKLVINGLVSADTEFESMIEYELPEEWDLDNTTLTTIVWKKEGSKYLFINGLPGQPLQSTTSTYDLSQEGYSLKSFQAYDDNLTIEISTPVTESHAMVELADLSGSIHRRENTSVLSNQNIRVIWSTSSLPSGLYTVILRTDRGILSKKIFLR